jgi:RimJ/RimL family protein N-acetyltransferase
MYINSLLLGNKVKLTSIKNDDIEKICEWYNDAYLLRLFDTMPSYPYSEGHIIDWIKTRQESNEHYMFAIRDKETDEFVGYIDLNGISWNNRVANLSIGIGSSAASGKGYGTEAMNLILKFGFHELNLHRIQLNVISYNEPAIALYEKVGLVREGCYREFVQRDGKKYDMYLYGILYPEWLKLQA